MTANDGRSIILHCLPDTMPKATEKDHNEYFIQYQVLGQSSTNIQYDQFTKRRLLGISNLLRIQKHRSARKQSVAKQNITTYYTYKQITMNKRKQDSSISFQYIAHNFSQQKNIMASSSAKHSRKNAKKRREKALCQRERAKTCSQTSEVTPICKKTPIIQNTFEKEKEQHRQLNR